ncbi:MAG: glutamyl-tRNA reductase [Deltaproteobacteria bacterium]|nr:glutamyl-tRNA reductase [Deltaproteobacteria bacterium]
MTESTRTPFVIGSSFHSAPLAVLEKIAISRDDLQSVVKELSGWIHTDDLAVLSTCNRTEIIGTTLDVARTRQQIVTYLNTVAENVTLQPEHLYCLTGVQAVSHLFNVVCGLDSMIIGETEIAGQLQFAFGVAKCEGLAGSYFVQLFDSAFRTNNRVRRETQIGEGTTSVARAAVHMARRIVGDLSDRRVLVLGAGETGTLACAYLNEEKATIFVANRTAEKAVRLAAEKGGTVVPFDRLEETLVDMDVVLLATGAKTPLITRQMIAQVQKRRRGELLVVVDISMPHNAEPEIQSVGNVFLFNMNDLKDMVAKSISRRAGEKLKAQQIVEEEVAAFFARQRTLEVGPIIAALRCTCEEMTAAELARFQNRLSDTDRQVFEQFAASLLNKILHLPTMAVRELATDQSGADGKATEKIAWFKKLFGLDKPKEERMRNK